MTTTPADVRAKVVQLRSASVSLTTRPWREIAEVLGAVGDRFLEDGDTLRDEALERLPADAGISSEMAAAVLDGMARDWTTERLVRTVESEFEDPSCLDEMTVVRGREVMAIGPRLCLQIVAGSVPGVGVHALLRSLLVKAPTLLKPGLGDRVLPELFERGVRAADPSLATGLAVCYWPGSAPEPRNEALAAADVVVVYGGDLTVREVRAAASSSTRVVGYHHRIGVALVGRDVMSPETIDGVASDTALAVAMFDQRGCVCPHVVYVEAGGELDGQEFARRLAVELERLAEVLPARGLDTGEGAALQQLRGAAELHAAAGSGFVLHGGPRASWTVVYEESAAEGPVTLGRGVRVRTLEDASELAARLEPVGAHLQSVAYAGLEGRTAVVAEAVGRVGASRVVPMGRVSFPPPWWLHDGRGPLRDLVRWVEVER